MEVVVHSAVRWRAVSRPAHLQRAVMVAAAALLASCGGGEGGAVSTLPSAPVVATVSVSPPSSQLVPAATVPLTATARDAGGMLVTGRAVAWNSNALSIATVDGNGVVTAVAVGTATIQATISGVVGTAAITVTALPAPTLEIVSGGTQQGLNGRPLADSLVVRVRAANGTPLAGIPVTWTTTGGTISSSTTNTDAQGMSRVQWTPSAGIVTATAASPALTPVNFSAVARAGGVCGLATNSTTQRFSLGATDFTLSLRASNPLRIAVLFVDYPGLTATETPSQLMASVIDPGATLLREMSYNRIDLTTVAFPVWYRMPQPISSYDWTTYAGHRQFLLDVIATTDATVDFSPFDALYVFSPPSTNKPVSPTFNGGISANVLADGRNFGNAVTFGLDSRSFGPSIMVHETGHMLGLVDLYAYVPAGGTHYAGNQFKYTGAWTLMSNVFNAAHILTWEKRKLGWIDESQVDCLDAPGGVEAILTPSQVAGGRKMVVVPIDASSALVVEVRNNLGLDANLCSAGVLLYQVDARIASGSGPAQVLGARVTTTGTAFNKCGPWADGVFGIGASAISSYVHAPSGATVTVLGVEANGAYRIRVKR